MARLAPEPPPGWDCHVHLFDGSAAAPGAHYQPVARPLSEIVATAAGHGCGHLVLVQPSVLGTDNSLLLQALNASEDRHRGVVVLHGGESADDLMTMHAAGVRGLRFNLVSPVGSAAADVERMLHRVGPSIDALGWHVQWYVAPTALPQLARWQAATRLPFVLDHLAGVTATTADAGTWEALARLAAAGAWIKLSGWYRLQAAAPYAELHAPLRRVAGLFGERMVWGSDWPHTSFDPAQLPPYASLWEPVEAALGVQRAQRVREAGALLYA